MYKCCWNCANGLQVCAETEEREIRINSSKRMCMANRPVSYHLENPFKQRYCKQFESRNLGCRFYKILTKEEAEKLNSMSVDGLVQYWKEVRSKWS